MKAPEERELTLHVECGMRNAEEREADFSFRSPSALPHRAKFVFLGALPAATPAEVGMDLRTPTPVPQTEPPQGPGIDWIDQVRIFRR